VVKLPVMPTCQPQLTGVNMPDYRPFDYAQATGAGTRNALAQMQTMQAAQQIKQAPEERIYLMQQREQQSQVQALDMQIKQNTVLKQGADQVLKAGGQGYENFKRGMEELGVSGPGELPDAYDEKLMKGLSGHAAGNLQKITKNMPGGMAQDILYQAGVEVERSKPYERWTPKQRGKGAGKGTSMKAADSNSISRKAGNLFGGMYDPESGRFSGLKGTDAEQKVQAIIERAEELFVAGATHGAAVSKAAREMGIDIKKLGKNDKDGVKKPAKSVIDFLEEQRNQQGG